LSSFLNAIRYTQGKDVTLDNMVDTYEAFVLKLKPRVTKEWLVLGVSRYGTPTSDDFFQSAEVGPKGDLYAYFLSNAGELDLGPALTLENAFPAEEFLVMTAVVKIGRKSLKVVEGIQSVYTGPYAALAVDKYGYTYLSGGELVGENDAASRRICDETFLLPPNTRGPLQMKLSSLDCLEAKCRAGKGCISK
jgi:hypothetical protein